MTQKSRGAANLAPVLMIVAFLSMIGFLWWLGATSEGTEVVAMNETDDAVADTTGGGVTEVTAADLMAPDPYVGQEIRVTAPVASRVGDQMFFIELPQAPFLVKLPVGQSPPQGQVEVVGTVMARTDSLLTRWVESGVVSEADELVVEYATHFLDARIVRPAPGGSGGGGGGGGGA